MPPKCGLGGHVQDLDGAGWSKDQHDQNQYQCVSSSGGCSGIGRAQCSRRRLRSSVLCGVCASLHTGRLTSSGMKQRCIVLGGPSVVRNLNSRVT